MTAVPPLDDRRLELLHELRRDVEVGVHVLDVVEVLEALNEGEDLAGDLLVRDLDPGRGLHGHLGGFRGIAGRRQRRPDPFELSRFGRHDERAALWASDVGGSCVDRGERDLVRIATLERDADDTLLLELPGDRRQRAAQLVEDASDLGRRAVPDIGHGRHDHGHVRRAKALVRDLLVLLCVGPSPGRALDRTLDVLLRHRVVTGLVDGDPQAVVGIRVAATLPRGGDDLAGQLGEERATLRVVGALLSLDLRPLAVPGHRSSFEEPLNPCRAHSRGAETLRRGTGGLYQSTGRSLASAGARVRSSPPMPSAALPDQATLPIFRILLVVQVLAAGFFGLLPFLLPETFASGAGFVGDEPFIYRLAGAATLGYAAVALIGSVRPAWYRLRILL